MKQYIVDAFTQQLFHGNQAAVCVLDDWLSEDLMMDITRENNFSETAFVVQEGSRWHLRWFTPGGEIDLCGHATLATAYVLFRFYNLPDDSLTFTTKSGDLTVRRAQGHDSAENTVEPGLLEMQFPAYTLHPIPVTNAMKEAFGARPREAYMGRDLLCVFDSAGTIRQLKPDMDKVAQLDGLLQHVTAPADTASTAPEGTAPHYDCISRSFCPKLQIAEDPVCGSGHCHIIPYWAKTLGKSSLTAYQASNRGGTLYCRMDGGKIYMAGHAVLFSVADLYV